MMYGEKRALEIERQEMMLVCCVRLGSIFLRQRTELACIPLCVYIVCVCFYVETIYENIHRLLVSDGQKKSEGKTDTHDMYPCCRRHLAWARAVYFDGSMPACPVSWRIL